MKLFFTAAIVSALCVCCSGGQGTGDVSGGNNPTTDSKQVTTGSDKDAHGCIGSAGYCWSEVQGRCIRLWEDGIKLSYLEKNDFSTAQFAAYLVFAPDSAKAEFFAPESEKPVLLGRKAGESKWFSGELTVGQVSGKWVVKQKNVIISIQAN